MARPAKPAAGKDERYAMQVLWPDLRDVQQWRPEQAGLIAMQCSRVPLNGSQVLSGAAPDVLCVWGGKRLP